jgi:hypothetical protein
VPLAATVGMNGRSYAVASVLSPCLNTVVDGLYRGSSSDSPPLR